MGGYLPLVLLAIPSSSIGYIAIEPDGVWRLLRRIFIDHHAPSAMEIWPSISRSAAAMAVHGFHRLPFGLAFPVLPCRGSST